MANRNNRFVQIKVDKEYFDHWFEPERRRMSQKLGVNFTQPKFTSFLKRSGAKITYPKRLKTYAPKVNKVKRGVGFDFDLKI